MGLQLLRTIRFPANLSRQNREWRTNRIVAIKQNSPVPDKVIGLECTIGVENVGDIIERVKDNGGKVLMLKTAIPYVGWIAKFLDTEGNLISAMQYNGAR